MITAIYIFIVFLAFFAGAFIGAIRLANKLSEATIKAIESSNLSYDDKKHIIEKIKEAIDES